MLKIKLFKFNPFPVNCYVLWDESGEAAIVDPGCCSPEERLALKNFIESNRLTVKHLLNTHLHLDHICGNPFVEETYGVKSEAHENDIYWLEAAPSQCRMFGFHLDKMPEPPSVHLHDGNLIQIGNSSLEVIHVPGHSPGSIVFHCAASQFLLSGDVLFQGSIGRTDLAGGNFDTLFEGICSRLFTLPPNTVVYPGHGASTTIGTEKAENPFFRR